ncbi:MAG: hypothetical protein OXD40_05705 [bacterium]|nr:hypothetical protein [bacterium]
MAKGRQPTTSLAPIARQVWRQTRTRRRGRCSSTAQEAGNVLALINREDRARGDGELKIETGWRHGNEDE